MHVAPAERSSCALQRDLQSILVDKRDERLRVAADVVDGIVSVRRPAEVLEVLPCVTDESLYSELRFVDENPNGT